MKRDLVAAARVQRALLPTALPDVPGVRFAWAFKPCEELGGDILNVVRLDDRHVGLYVLDACGHGVASALLSVTVSRFLSTVPDSSSLLLRKVEGTSGYTLVPAAEVAAQLNRRFLFNAASEQYFTIVYGILDLESLQFRYISAGHPALIYVPAGAPAAILEAPGFPIGITHTDYEEHTICLKPGDRLYLYSDGIIEAKNASEQLLGKRGLADFLDEGRATPSKGPSPICWGPSSGGPPATTSMTTSRSWPWRSRPPATVNPGGNARHLHWHVALWDRRPGDALKPFGSWCLPQSGFLLI